MADNGKSLVSPNSTHLIHYLYSAGPGQFSTGCAAYTLPAGWVPANYEWVTGQLREAFGQSVVVTGVTAFERPTINRDALREALNDLADAADAGASQAALAEGLRRMIRTIK